ncbi:hypothetical protein ACJO1Y_23725 [Vibrio parahaemolyticus]|uniref:hypothetical protein n=1 Tax=Vibrio parahaemolyticus TaxID=670 RepID=UPI0023602DDC|nr:hypothetical protein [Vibrio parahaemolyticus]EHQ9269882.1 hypothetical protein [Vibrio parahaemolyticus]MDG2666790.1 hypothetical protein [Vibrio parahaemolyticus]MDG2789662.1 hypothetical protein [Vibrio parahaemolyticus]
MKQKDQVKLAQLIGELNKNKVLTLEEFEKLLQFSGEVMKTDTSFEETSIFLIAILERGLVLSKFFERTIQLLKREPLSSMLPALDYGNTEEHHRCYLTLNLEI